MSSPAAPAAVPLSIRARLGCLWVAKLSVWGGLALGICIPYFGLQAMSLTPGSPPASFIDEWIDFQPAWIWAYVSLALLVPLAPSMAGSREELIRYSRGLALLCAICFAIFFLMPVAGPRPEVMPDHDLYRMIVSVDRPTNSLPSLHAGLTLYSLLFGWRALRPGLGTRGRLVYAAGAALWLGLILYSTLATRQHWFADLPPGMVIAWGAHQWAWRGAEEPSEREGLALTTG